MAFSRNLLEQQPLHNTIVGGEPVVIAWFPEYETLGVCSRRIDGREIEVSDIDVYGNTGDGKLKRIAQYPHVFWMVCIFNFTLTPTPIISDYCQADRGIWKADALHNFLHKIFKGELWNGI